MDRCRNTNFGNQRVKMNDTIIVDGNRPVSIRSIRQVLTYGGLLEGIPTREMNGRILDRVKEEAKKFCHLDNVYLIEPEQRPIEYSGRYPFGEPAQLPNVICIVELRCYSVFKDKSKDFSGLGLIWFQDDFMFAIDATISEKMKVVPFAKVCGEFGC